MTATTAATAVEVLTINGERVLNTTDNPDAGRPEQRLPIIAAWLTTCRLLDTVPTIKGYLAFVAAVSSTTYQPARAEDQTPAWVYLLHTNTATDPESGGDMWTVNLTIHGPNDEQIELWADHESGGNLTQWIADAAEMTADTYAEDEDSFSHRYWLDRSELWANQN